MALESGAAQVDITPGKPMFLWGYPHVTRTSTGTHDPLLSSALYLSDGATRLLFIGIDVIFVSHELAARVRARIAEITGVPASNILVAATHTHSGPITLSMLSNENDPVVPPVDHDYLRRLEDGIVSAGCAAVRATQPAEAGLAIADGRGLGTHRHHPDGPADPDVPVLMVRRARDRRPIACMAICCMHPTVLHEDSTLFSGDFPGLARACLQRERLGRDIPVVYFSGPAGNQSPRHVVRANTIDEAQRLGERLGASILKATHELQYTSHLRLQCRGAMLDLEPRIFPTVALAERELLVARERLKRLRAEQAAPQAIRTAEVDVFGAEETLVLARAAAEGRLEAVIGACMPLEIQVLAVGPWKFAAWPGEFFVEYGLDVRRQVPNSFVITYANGELQGYIATEEAEAGGWYEARNAVFSARNGPRVVERTVQLLKDLQ